MESVLQYVDAHHVRIIKFSSVKKKFSLFTNLVLEKRTKSLSTIKKRKEYKRRRNRK